MNKATCSNDNHKYGLFKLNFDNGGNAISAERQCRCPNCKKVTIYSPVDTEIMEEVKKQNEASFVLDSFLHRSDEIINDSDDFIKYISLLLNGINYLELYSETQERYMEKIDLLNEVFHNDKNIDTNRHKLVSDFHNYLNIYFKKERIEYMSGIGSFSDEDYETLDKLHDSIVNRIDKFLELFYNNKEKTSYHR